MNPDPDAGRTLGWEQGKSLYGAIFPLPGGNGGPEQVSASPRHSNLTILIVPYLDRSISSAGRLLMGIRRVYACRMWPS